MCLSNFSLHIVFVLCCLCFGGLDSCVFVGDLFGLDVFVYEALCCFVYEC
jgi:hypothetical protein